MNLQNIDLNLKILELIPETGHPLFSDGISRDGLRKESQKKPFLKKMTGLQFDWIIDRLKQEGKIIEPKPNWYQRVGDYDHDSQDEKIKNGKGDKMPVSNVTGEYEPRERVLVPDDSYEGTVLEVSDPFDTTYKDKTTSKRSVQVEFEFEKETKTLPMFLTNSVTKGSGDYSSSKLFELLEVAGILKEYEENEERLKDDNNFTVWINEKIKDKKVKFTTKRVNKNDSDKTYSVIDRIVRFTGA